MITGPNSMSVTNTRGIRAPIARNWVSCANQKRTIAVQNELIRQSTKYAEMRWSTPSSDSFAGTEIIVLGNSNGMQTPRNVFTADIANMMNLGLTPSYTDTYQPPFVAKTQFTIQGSDWTTTQQNKEWIVWNSTEQKVEVKGSVSISTSDATPRVIRLQIFVNGKPQPLTSDQRSVISPINRIDAGTPSSSTITISQTLTLNRNDVVTLVIDRLDQPQDNNITCLFYGASLSVKTLTIT